MSSVTYMINKGVNRPLEFRGLKAQYVVYLAIGLVGLLLGFAILYLAGVPTFGCLGIVLTAGGFLFHYVFRLSRKYGQHGLMKVRAAKKIPRVLCIRSRRDFY